MQRDTAERFLPQSALPWWCAIQADTGDERGTGRRLAEQKFETLVPMCLETKRHARKTVEVETALFPGYLFAQIIPQQNAWWEATGIKGVIRVVGDGRIPWRMPAAVIVQLQRRIAESPHGLIRLGQFEPGQRIHVEAGALASTELDGVFLEHVGRDRVRIMLDMMGQSVRFVVPKAQVW